MWCHCASLVCERISARASPVNVIARYITSDAVTGVGASGHPTYPTDRGTANEALAYSAVRSPMQPLHVRQVSCERSKSRRFICGTEHLVGLHQLLEQLIIKRASLRRLLPRSVSGSIHISERVVHM